MELQEQTQEEYTEYEQEEGLYPKFNLTDEDGNPIRDARHYPFVSRSISSVNRLIASSFRYQHFEDAE